MNIDSGKGSIPFVSVIAILSISLLVNLPGLAVSPMLAELDTIFPRTSQLEIQLLTILPNLFIIPFVLLAGKIASSSSKTNLLLWSLIIYLASGILYLLANAMWQLIIISCLLGIGCGLLIPLAASLITDNFEGEPRMKMLGIKSGVANLALVVATFVVGWLGKSDWHFPFMVYLLPIIPLALFGYMRHYTDIPKPELQQSADIKGSGFMISRIVSLTLLYFAITFFVVVLSYYLPFLLAKHGIDGSKLGTITSLFFLAIFLPGFILPYVVTILRRRTVFFSMLSIAIGLLLMCVGYTMTSLCIGAFLMGWGYGVIQPTIYDKATRTVTTPAKNSMALAIVLATNYVAVTLAPFIIDLIRTSFSIHSNLFPFILNGVLATILSVVIFVRKDDFAFDIYEGYLSKKR